MGRFQEHQHFYAAFGYVTSAFAEMEADLRMLIAGLAFRDDSITAAAFLDSTQMGENAATLKKLSRQHWDHEAACKLVFDGINKIRERRNLFIHGIWDPGTFGKKAGFATVRDLNCKYEPGETMRKWAHGSSTEYSVDQFNDLLREIREVSNHIAKLCTALEKDEDVEFGHFKIVTSSRPMRIPVDLYLAGRRTTR